MFNLINVRNILLLTLHYEVIPPNEDVNEVSSQIHLAGTFHLRPCCWASPPLEGISDDGDRRGPSLGVTQGPPPSYSLHTPFLLLLSPWTLRLTSGE